MFSEADANVTAYIADRVTMLADYDLFAAQLLHKGSSIRQYIYG